MAYKPTEWKNGDVIEAAKLNNIEQGIANVELTPGPAGKDGVEGKQGPAGKAGAAGKDGFPTKEQWDALVARVAALETPAK